MQTLPLIADVRISEAHLESWPLPASLVMQGEPQASGLVLAKSDDARIVRGIWASTPGRFRWEWSYDETVVVISGRATVELSDGRRVELVPGSMAYFERGLQSVWTIHEDFRKGFHALSPEPLPF
ncbi:MAG: cupin domain-containing protein [Candidatus Eisenbacteria bacterium]